MSLALTLAIACTFTLPQSDEKGPVASLSARTTPTDLLRLGNTWQVTECCGWTGTWTRRPATNTFDAAWRHTNGAAARDIITLTQWNKQTGEVVLTRAGNNGTYKGTFDATTGRILRGQASWYPAGQQWSASLFNDADSKGPVRVQLTR